MFSRLADSYVMEPLAYIIVVALGYIDYSTGSAFSLSIFYLIPVFGVAWFKGTRRALPISAASAVAFLIGDMPAKVFYLHPINEVWNAGAVFIFYVLVSMLVGLLHDGLTREARIGRTDFLTKLANAKAFVEAAEAEIRRAKRYNLAMSVAYIDLDDFKTVNDSFGHSRGDELLIQVGAAITKNVRETDLAARIGGDEFSILFPETSGAQAKVVADKLQVKLDELFKENSWPVGASIGVADFPAPPESVDQILEQADKRMFAAKQLRKDAKRARETASPRT
jgi:diguanylate cyclase (GGDEF)-like protein